MVERGCIDYKYSRKIDVYRSVPRLTTIMSAVLEMGTAHGNQEKGPKTEKASTTDSLKKTTETSTGRSQIKWK